MTMTPHEPISPEQIRPLVRAVFAQAEIAACAPSPGARDSPSYDLRLDHPALEVVFKTYADPASARRETHLLGLLTSETGVPVPRVLLGDDSGATVPYPWALLTCLPGRPLSGILDTLSDEELALIGYEMGRYLGHMHQIPLDTFGQFLPPPLSPHSEVAYIAARAAPALETCRERGLLPAAVIELLQQLLGSSPLLDRPQACLIHGAFGPSSVIVERGAAGYHVTGFLGFECAIGGSPELEMAPLFAWTLEGRPSFEKEFLDGYVELGEIGPRFWDRLELHQALVCLERLVALPDDGGRRGQDCRSRIAACVDRLYSHR
jgi:aminoglycoside phosphotransferase (APT) family kinase protein